MKHWEMYLRALERRAGKELTGKELAKAVAEDFPNHFKLKISQAANKHPGKSQKNWEEFALQQI